ncbi:hypothetical protein FQR65_LT10771 [Abscondita terminalis]|nr:hypothetical protein FQR65_LT10771 [Abscondita terminalis]
MAEEEVSKKGVGKSVLDRFSQISNDNESRRIKNACLLLQYLHKSSSDQNFDEVQYALKRIVRGLGGSKNSTRIGFYSTFVALLHAFPFLTLEEILSSVQKHLQVEGGNSKSEVGDIYIGRVLACGALIRSKKIFAGSKQLQDEVVRLLINAGNNRSYLSMAAVKFISELLSMCDEGNMKTFWKALSEEVLKPWPEQNLDSLYLLLVIRKSFPTFLKSCDEILCEGNLEAICNIALNITTVSSLNHYFYPLLGETIATSDFDLSFAKELDRQLVRYNRNRLMAASLIIRTILARTPDASKIPDLIPDQFVAQILHHHRNNRVNNKNDDEFHKEIANFFDDLTKRLQADAIDAKIKIGALKKFIFYPGSFMFESVTKTKNVQKIVRTLDKEGVKKLSALYRNVLVMKKEKMIGANATEPWLNSERIYSAQLLAKLLGLPLMQNDIKWKVKNLKLLMDVSLLRNKYTNVGVELAGNVKDVFFRALDLKFSKLDDVGEVLYQLVDYARSELENLRTPLGEDDVQIFERVYAVAKTDSLVFQVLFLHMGLQMFHDKELAVSSLNELFACYERVNRKRKDAADPEWIEVVVDLFLNLLSHSSLLLRNVVGSVFPFMCKDLTPSSIHQILAVLDPKNEINPLEDEDDEDSSSEDEVEDDDDLVEDETVNDKLRMAVQAALGNNGYHTDEESVDLDDMDEDDAERLDQALSNAFKQFKPNRGKSKKQTKKDEALTHFRIRALDLIEIYLDSEPSLLSCLEMVPPLLQILEFTIRDDHQKPLLMRIRHCLRKLTGVKKFDSLDGVTEEVLGDLLNGLLDKGTKNSMLIQDMSNEISECCVFIVKCALMPPLQGCQGMMIDILSNALNVYFKQRDCLIPYVLFKSVFQLQWRGNLVFAPMLFGFAFNNEIRPFRRNQALDLLQIFYAQRGVDHTFTAAVAKHETELCDQAIAMFDGFCRSPNAKDVKEKFVVNLFNLLKSVSKRNQNVDWKTVGQKIREFRSHVPLSQDAKRTYNQLCGALAIPRVVRMQPEVTKIDRTDSDEKPATNKRAEIEKQKKEAKTRRAQSMSEGLAQFSFVELDEEDAFANGVSPQSRKRRKSESANGSPKKSKINLNKSAHV